MYHNGARKCPEEAPKLQTGLPEASEEKRGGTQINQKGASRRAEKKGGQARRHQVANRVPEAPRG